MTTTDRILVGQGTFAVIGSNGDITGREGATPDGLFLRDARHLSRWRLTANGQPLAVLTGTDENTVLVPPGTRDEPPAYTALREQAVGAGVMVERIRLLNNLPRPVRADVELTVDADFADQFELRSDKRHYDKTGAERETAEQAGGVTFHYRRGADWSSSTGVTAVPAPDAVRAVPEEDGSRTARVLVWQLALPPHGSCELTLAVTASAAHGPAPAEVVGDRGLTAPAVLRAQQSLDEGAFVEASPQPDQMTDQPELARAVRQGLVDLAGLRVPATGVDGEAVRIPGAGTPWFLTLFGRDSLLTSLFSLPYRPGIAAAVLTALAAAQGTGYEPSRLEQPGRIPHELRHGELAHFHQVPYGRYYGSVDATPLFLVLLQSYTEATGDTALARRLEPHARAAVDWMFRDGGLDSGGWLVYTSDEAAGGLANQNWKDSAGAICFADGTQATGAIAVAEAQGYAYDALRRTARLASEVWRDDAYARRLDSAADGLRQRFPQEFWLAEADFPALALDGERARVDALGSDAGHLLWSGILDQGRAERVARRLLQPDFFSGWGIRTLAAGQSPYHPLSYHRGGIWPHDNAVIALGLARHGLVAEARTVATALLETARHYNWRLPEVVAGYDRSQHTEPVPYPHACSPQAWAAATPLALLTALHGTSTPHPS
ncbi:Glycogen debranching enzyme (alpha-1,6-glucosidase) [Streptomyces sp. DvalAA-14]|uniref:amylo-alpha-1,6-glucosidase n=1 Tax=unclassified Streptomyces TaxID=2593676 RepID=UPI00081B9D08|nr:MULTISPECIES: glycogen debranching N-terminal domain-containing protein [unclassified Streptomyces]MYS22767.1 aminotransferase [Streptomyces sp. SID4948]SCE22171.1 Glycogen debranching enzyme (alpha-1,6-glucosidase) [Streptomyces sp. DvalAA-14]